MAEDSYPFDTGTPVLEEEWRAMARIWADTGIAPVADGDDELQVFADSTGLLVKIPSGRAWVDGHYYRNSAQMTLNMPGGSPPHATLARRDRIILRADFVANTVTAVWKPGTAGASPVPPTLQQDTSMYEFGLAVVLVPAVAANIAAGNVTDTRTFSVVGDSTPVGMPLPWLAASPPRGFVRLNGATVSRWQYARLFTLWGTGYGAGDGSTTFGLPDMRGRTVFGQDDMGASDAGRLSTSNTVGTAGGAETVTLDAAAIPAHVHTISITSGIESTGHRHSVSADGAHDHTVTQDVDGTASTTHTHDVSGNAGSPSGGLFGSDVADTSIEPTHAHGSITGFHDTNHTHAVSGNTGSIGSGGAHSNMPPFMTVAWVVRY